MSLVGWVTGCDGVTDPRVAAAVAEAGHPALEALHLGAAPALVPVAVGVSGDVRVVVGEVPHTQLLLSANVDDLDPRLWPGVLAALLGAGAADAWLTPIVMKKGRPAHTVSVLLGRDSLAAVRRVLLAETTTIGFRQIEVTKHALPRHEATVDVGGQPVRLKIATDGGIVVNVMPEWDDVEAAARALGRPARSVLSDAHAAASPLRSADAHAAASPVWSTDAHAAARAAAVQPEPGPT